MTVETIQILETVKMLHEAHGNIKEKQPEQSCIL